MQVKNVTMAQLEAAAQSAGVRLTNVKTVGRRIRFRLGLIGEQYRRLSPSTGHKVAAVCWHGHAAFMDALFAAVPDAVLSSHMATYHGIAEYRAKMSATAETNIGNAYNVVYYHEACTCEL
jgi:hypothetical protein